MTLHKVPSIGGICSGFIGRTRIQNLLYSVSPPCVFSPLVSSNSSSFHTIYFPTLLSFFLHLVAMIRYLRDQLNIPIFNAGGSLPARLLNPLPPTPATPNLRLPCRERAVTPLRPGVSLLRQCNTVFPLTAQNNRKKW